MKKKSVKKNYIYNLIYQILNIIIPIITIPYLSRVLGANGIGIYSYTISIVTYFVLIGSLGINLYGQREIAYVQNDVKKRSKIFFELIIFKTIALIISMIIFYFIFCNKGEYHSYYLILLIEIFANIFDINWFYQGLEEFKKIVIRNIIVRIISIIFVFLFVKTSKDVDKYLVIYSLTTLFGNAILWIELKKYIILEFNNLNFIKHIKPNIILFIPQIATQIYTVLDKTMIGAILNDMNEVGYYEQSQKIIKLLLSIITSMGTVMLPRIASYYNTNDNEKINFYMEKSFKFVFLLCFPMTFGLIAVSGNFVPLFFGIGYEKVSILISILSFVIIFIGLSNTIGTQYLLSTKKQKEYTISIIIGACINVILNYVLIKKYLSIGACIATIIAEFFVTLVQLYYVKNIFDFKKITMYAFKYILYSFLMFILVYLINYLNINVFVKLILQLFVGIVTYLSCLIVNKDEHLYIIKKTLKK